MQKPNFFRSPAFNILATVVLVAALAVFYMFAIADYEDGVKESLDTLDTERLSQVIAIPKTLDEAYEVLEYVDSVREIDMNLIEYCRDNIRDDMYDRICEYMEAAEEYDDKMWEELCGYSLIALYDLANDLVDEDDGYIIKDDSDSLTLAFAGDVNLDARRNNTWSPLVVHKDSTNNLLEAAFSPELSEKMIDADFFSVNLESPFITEDMKPTGGKWSHGSLSENVDVLGILGIDMVNLANDRIFDFGADGLAETVRTLKSAGIPYMGGGANLKDSRVIKYMIACGRKIAILSASQAKLAGYAPEPTSAEAGALYAESGTYFTDMIETARENADYVIVYADWAKVKTQKPDNKQVTLAHSFVDAGADIVIGVNGSVMQSVEYYNGAPIVYGLGYFWYETDRHETLFLEINFDRVMYTEASEEDPSVIDEAKTRYSPVSKPDVYLLPCIQDKAVTSLVLGTEDGDAIYEKLTNISDGKIMISEDGLLSEAVSAEE